MTVQTIPAALARKELIHSRSLRIILASGSLTICMALGAMARIRLPFTPVPFTMQVFFLFFGALALGRRSALSQGGYLALGALGMPVFHGFAGGISALSGITAGYLFGFVTSAFLIGALVSSSDKPSLSKDAAALAIGMLGYYIPGVLWLKAVTGMNLSQALAAGFLPFILMDCVKAGLAYSLYRAARKRISHLL